MSEKGLERQGGRYIFREVTDPVEKVRQIEEMFRDMRRELEAKKRKRDGRNKKQS